MLLRFIFNIRLATYYLLWQVGLLAVLTGERRGKHPAEVLSVVGGSTFR